MSVRVVDVAFELNPPQLVNLKLERVIGGLQNIWGICTCDTMILIQLWTFWFCVRFITSVDGNGGTLVTGKTAKLFNLTLNGNDD